MISTFDLTYRYMKMMHWYYIPTYYIHIIIVKRAWVSVLQHPQMTTNPDEEPSVLAQLMMSGLRRRRQRTNLTGVSVSDKMTIPTANIVTEEMSRETRVRLHTLATAAQVMAVRFNLGSEEEDDKKYLDLCVLKYGANGVLEVSPDFTHASKPYRVEVRQMHLMHAPFWLLRQKKLIGGLAQKVTFLYSPCATTDKCW